MRTIDADAFDATMYEAWKNNEVTNEEWVHFREMIKDEPTIEPQRMRGRWIPTEPDEPCFYLCSICRRLNDEKDNFCKNCGADMREGGEDADR